MGKLHDHLMKDIRFVEGLNTCMNCGVCTAICPAAEFYHYDPREICDTIQNKDESQIESLLRSETIWYCGQCMSCKTRCPQDNTPGFVVQALRKVSQELGYFTDSEKGRQQFALKRVIGRNILQTGYCMHPDLVTPQMHPEQGPVWEWQKEHIEEMMERIGANYKGDGPGILRKIPRETLDELQSIFDVTGGTDRYNKIEAFSKLKADDLGIEFGEGTENDYFRFVYSTNNNKHYSKE